MQAGANTKSLIAQADTLLARARHSLEGNEGFFEAHVDDALRMHAHLLQERETELRRFIFEEVGRAQQQPPLPAPTVDLDQATRFARQVRRRRSLV